jgi:EF-P beta-lysylation protein EpmB
MNKKITALSEGQMIMRTALNDTPDSQTEAWKTALSQAVTNPKQLLKRLQLNPALLSAEMQTASEQFRVFVTESYLKRIVPENPADPLLLQVLPRELELQHKAGYSLDPLDEKQASKHSGLLHKYSGRALIITNGHCAINCRFCFRRNFPYEQNHLSKHSREEIFSYLSEDPGIEEVILSGGDPLLLSDNKLQELVEALSSIPHLKRLRVHSRVPIVLPERITDRLISLLENCPLKLVMVVHCNHAQEIDDAVADGIGRLRPISASLLNQSVLLKGVNDSARAQIDLQKSLFEIGVQPYYLHLLDKVHGAAHFDIPMENARSIYQEMQSSLPGYLVPKLVMESPGEAHKLQITL